MSAFHPKLPLGWRLIAIHCGYRKALSKAAKLCSGMGKYTYSETPIFMDSSVQESSEIDPRA